MANPVFNSSPVFTTKGAPKSVPAPGQYTTTPLPGQISASDLETMYRAPAAGPLETGRMTYDDVIFRTIGLGLLIVVAGAATWIFAPQLYIGGAIVGLVLGFVNALKKKPSPALIALYALAEGVFLGGISAIFESIWPGVVIQAVLATAATFVACLLLFTSGKVRVTAKFTKVVLVATVGYAIFCLVNLCLMWFGNMDGFGLRSTTVAGIPLGLVIGLVAVVLASAMLIMDFDAIKRGVESGAPREFAWTAAFGLVVTLVWLYLEFLRLLAVLRN